MSWPPNPLRTPVCSRTRPLTPGFLQRRHRVMQARALVTGFAPYGHRGCNPAAEVALAMDGKTVAGAQVIGRTLPVAYTSLRSEIGGLLAQIQPAVAISLGLWPGEPVIRIERIGVNVADFEIPDNEGKLLVDEAIQADGLAARLSTLPIRKIEQALLDAGIPARISSTPGRSSVMPV